MLEASMTWWWWLSRHALRIQGNQPSQESCLTSRSWTIQMMSAFQATIGGRFAPLAMLVDEDADLDSMDTHSNKAVTDTTAELLGKQRRKRKPWVTPEVLDICDQRRDLKKKRGAPEGAKDYREINRKIRIDMQMAKETWTQCQCQEVEACLRKNNIKKAHQLVRDLTTEKQGIYTAIQDKSGKCLTEGTEILNRWTEYCSDYYNYETDTRWRASPYSTRIGESSNQSAEDGKVSRR